MRNRKKTLKVTVEEMQNFALAYVEKYAPSKQQLKTYLLKKYMRVTGSDIKKNDVNNLIDIVLSDLEKNKFINGIVRPAPTAIINVGITALKITNQLKEFFLFLFISKRVTLSTFTLNKK